MESRVSWLRFYMVNDLVYKEVHLKLKYRRNKGPLKELRNAQGDLSSE